MPDIPDDDPLEISHLVVRGAVIDMKFGQFDLSSGAPGTTPLSLPSVTIKVRVQEVLRGSWREPEIEIVGLHDQSAFRTGEYIICCLWYEHRKKYITAPHLGIWSRAGIDRWVQRLSAPRFAGEEKKTPRVLTMAQIRGHVENGSLRGLTRNSDVIVRGTIDSTYTVAYRATNDKSGVMTHYRMQTIEVLKGKIETTQLDFVVPVIDAYLYVPEWGRYHYPDIARGEEWLVFLKRGDHGLYPFAARNSFLHVDEGRLIYDSVVEYPYSLIDTIRRIRLQIAREQG